MMNKKQICVLGFLLFMLAACAAPQSGMVPSDDSEKLVLQLEADLGAAGERRVHQLAPGPYSEAMNALMKARQVLEEEGKPDDISRYVAQGRASLNSAEEIARVAGDILSQVDEARGKALDAGADQLGNSYEEVENQYRKLAQAIINDNLAYARKNAAMLQAAYRNIEIAAIKSNVLGAVREIMAEADASKVQKLVPTAYDDARTALIEADAYIGEHPYEVEGIRLKASHAELMAERLLALHESSEKFRDMAPEEAAIYLEGLMVRLGNALKTEDLRDRVTSAQVIALTDAAMAMVRQRQSIEIDYLNAQAEVSELEQQIVGLEGVSRQEALAREKLEAEREFNQRFNQIQGYFSADEAEVYKKGNQLIIRLKGIRFPVGKAALTAENYALLGKVQRAISTFGEPTMIIEGHTDSTGSIQKNLALSEQRAEAVKAYLVANKTLPESHIQATGYGPNRPLAPNTTPENRALNRRIDVVITPEEAG
jgi:outer membrane protein OmpA-like peptidoglycan-associated protein